ncbi:putative FAS1 domain-containing protein [Armadillidium vulgare iridescent virus]|uniref:Putative FAS1 domain-containing protein n=1 Tax=Armadillidium vulgare iridescent virus TaxID=72201 RepID=A0A068QKB7_9VIRU|nr:putative FAS1 domain-containing protein [Armadillidium vulgare iridescent virus]CCV02467.1 putative FAS1 domain-containing protein [Armadillidium vulgare iridescent virus]
MYFFRNMAAKSLIAKDFNDANIMYHTIFVPISFIGGEEMVPNEYISSLTIPGQFFILPNEIPTNIKVQNKLKEYLSVNIESKGRGGGAYVQAVDRLWKVTSANVPCSNGMIHFLQEVYV